MLLIDVVAVNSTKPSKLFDSIRGSRMINVGIDPSIIEMAKSLGLPMPGRRPEKNSLPVVKKNSLQVVKKLSRGRSTADKNANLRINVDDFDSIDDSTDFIEEPTPTRTDTGTEDSAKEMTYLPESQGNNDSTSNQLFGTFIDTNTSKGVAEELTSLPESHGNNDSTSNQLLGETGNLLGDINDAHIVSGHDKVITQRFQKRVEKAFNGHSLGT